MHRTVEASVSSERTDAIVKELLVHPHVVGLNVLRSASLKPAGDTLSIHVLNKGIDDVMRTLTRHTDGSDFSIITSELASISDPKHQKKIDHDIDEAIWEEMETGLRHNGRLTPNYMMLMAIGGVIAAIGFVSQIHNLVIAFVAASIIAPGLEPLAKIPLGLVLKKKDVLWTGFKATLAGYLMIALFAALTFILLQTFSNVQATQFLESEATKGLIKLPLKDFILSLMAASASIIMYLSYRRNVIAGPLIALILIPATAAIGMCLTLGEWNYALAIFKRLVIDIGLVIGTGLVLIFIKQKFVHKRKSIR